MFDDGARSLIAGILRASLEDYYECLLRLKKEEWEKGTLERFFRSEWCYWLSSSIGIDMNKAVERVVEISEQQSERSQG